MTKWFHLVSHRRWDRLGRTGREHTLHRWCRLRAIPQTAFVNFDQPPPAKCDAMRVAQTTWHGDLVPDMAGTDLRKAVWHLGAIAQRAVNRAPLVLSTADWIENPKADLEWRPMAEMRVLATAQLGSPVPEIILVVSADRPFHLIQTTRNIDGPRLRSSVSGGEVEANQCARSGMASR